MPRAEPEWSGIPSCLRGRLDVATLEGGGVVNEEMAPSPTRSFRETPSSKGGGEGRGKHQVLLSEVARHFCDPGSESLGIVGGRGKVMLIPAAAAATSVSY